MRYLVRKSVVRMIGRIWMPAITCAKDITLSEYDVENIRRYRRHSGINRDSVDHWLALNSGDFQSIVDFEASIEDGENTVDIPWRDEESESHYDDAMYPEED